MTDLINNIVKEDWIPDDCRKGIRLLVHVMKVLEQQMKVLERGLDVKCQLLL